MVNGSLVLPMIEVEENDWAALGAVFWLNELLEYIGRTLIEGGPVSDVTECLVIILLGTGVHVVFAGLTQRSNGALYGLAAEPLSSDEVEVTVMGGGISLKTWKKWIKHKHPYDEQHSTEGAKICAQSKYFRSADWGSRSCSDDPGVRFFNLEYGFKTHNRAAYLIMKIEVEDSDSDML